MSDITLHEEFIVCHAVGYPDPIGIPTLAEALAFAATHTFNQVTRQIVTPVVKRRWVSDWEDVSDG